MPGIDLTLPPLEARLTNRPEAAPAKVKAWLAQQALDPPAETARIVGDALAVLNRARIADTVRLELMELYNETTEKLWPLIRRDFNLQTHPLNQDALKAARNATHLISEVAHGYKRVLVENAEKRIAAGSTRLRLGLIHRTQQCLARVLLASFSSHCPVPPNTWRDLHQVYVYARRIGLHREPVSPANPALTPETSYIQTLLLALSNPYGLMPGQLTFALRFLGDHSKQAQLSESPPDDLHDSVLATVNLDSDRPPALGAKRGSAQALTVYLDNAKLAKELNRELRELESLSSSGAQEQDGSRMQYLDFLRGLKRHWRTSVTGDLPRFGADSRVIVTSGFARVWDCAQGSVPAAEEDDTALDATTVCSVLSHAPNNGYALRQLRALPGPVRVGELIGMRALVGGEWQVGVVRWFRNTMTQHLIEFGCEMLGRRPEAAAVVVERVERRRPHPVLILAAEPDLEWNETLITAPQLLDAAAQATLQKHGAKLPIKVSSLRENNLVFSQYDFAPAR